MQIFTFDDKNALLHGRLREIIYMSQSLGFEDRTGRVCLLKKSLYDLKQALIVREEEFSDFIKSLYDFMVLKMLRMTHVPIIIKKEVLLWCYM